VDRATVKSSISNKGLRKLDQLNAAKPYTKAAFRISKPKTSVLGSHAPYMPVSGNLVGSIWILTAQVLGAALDAMQERNPWCTLSIQSPTNPASESIQRALDLLARAQRHSSFSQSAAYAQSDAEFALHREDRYSLSANVHGEKGSCLTTILNPQLRPLIVLAQAM